MPEADGKARPWKFPTLFSMWSSLPIAALRLFPSILKKTKSPGLFFSPSGY